MKAYKGIAELQCAPKNSVVTIGNFDGVHLGHQELLRAVVEHAARIQGTPIAFTFRPHPRFLLRPTDAPLLLNTYEEKLELMGRAGIEIVIEEPFTKDFSNKSAEHFVAELLLPKLGTKVLYLGYDFAFGKGRTGSVETIQRIVTSHGVETVILPPFKQGEEPVSSTRIRTLLDAGDIAAVNRALGRPFFLRGFVKRGDGRGRQIGVPTANIEGELRKFPRTGVYATRTHSRGRSFPSITNIGFNPTFKGEGTGLPLKIETHIFDFSMDIYEDEIQVDFFAFIRPEQKFSGVESLLAQMQQDFREARRVLS
jgi:riboflavin kinase/FMN adenylyltransferase